MGLKKLFIIRDYEIAERACRYIAGLAIPEGKAIRLMITEYRPSKTQDQTDKYEAMINAIKASGKFVFMGHNDWSRDDIKRLLIDAFSAIRAEEGRPLEHPERITPSLDGKRIVSLAVRSRDFSVEEASEFIEYLYAYGAGIGMVWRM